MEPYYQCTWINVVNQKNEKIGNLSLLMKIISTVPKVLFFKITYLYTVYPFSEYAENENMISLGQEVKFSFR